MLRGYRNHRQTPTAIKTRLEASSAIEITQHFAPPAPRLDIAADIANPWAQPCQSDNVADQVEHVHGIPPSFARTELRWQGKQEPSARAGETQANAEIAG